MGDMSDVNIVTAERLRLRGQTGASTGLDLIYTVHYE